MQDHGRVWAIRFQTIVKMKLKGNSKALLSASLRGDGGLRRIMRGFTEALYTMITCSPIAAVSRSTPALRLPRFFFMHFVSTNKKDRPATNRGIFEMKIKNDLLKGSFTSPRRIAILEWDF